MRCAANLLQLIGHPKLMDRVDSATRSETNITGTARSV
jgi:hypothetical protein